MRIESLKSRKKTLDPLEIDESTEETQPLTSDTTDDNNNQPSSYVLTSTNKILCIIAIILFSIILFSSAETKKIRQERNAKQIEALSKSIQKQKTALAQKYNNLRAAISNEKTELDVVTKDYHEEQVKALQSNHQDEINKLQSNHEIALSNKQKEIDNLNADIEKRKKELLDIKSKLDGFEEEVLEFCYDCVYDHAGMRTSCGARLEFLIKRYGGTEDKTEEDYKAAIVRWDPNCKKTDP